MRLLAAIPMNSVFLVSARIISRFRGEAFQCIKSRWSPLSLTSLERLKLLHASATAACSLTVGDSLTGKSSNQRM